MAGARRAAVEEAFMRRGLRGIATFRRRYRSLSGRQRAEDRLEAKRRVMRPADHQAVAAVGAPHAAARADVEIVNAPARERLGSPHVVLEVAVAAVDDRVAGLELF